MVNKNVRAATTHLQFVEQVHWARLICRIKLNTKVNRSRFKFLLLGMMVGLYVGTNILVFNNKMDCLLSNVIEREFSVFPFEESPGGNDKGFLFIGIMTVREHLDTRARASNLTWVPHIPGKVVYFVGEGEPYTGDLDVVELEGVTDQDYPPQKKSFAMIQYINKHYGNDYQWFIRADDDAYFKAQELVGFLMSIDNTGYRYIGQPGFGKIEEKGKLGLSGAFCMGGPGVIMSSSLLKDVAPKLKYCLNATTTAHEDTELGRCIHKATGSFCTDAFEMRKLFYQNYEEIHLANSSFKKELGKDELRALTLHPLKESPYVFRLDTFLSRHKLSILERKVGALKHEVATLPLPSRYNRKEKLSLADFKRATLFDPHQYDQYDNSSGIQTVHNAMEPILAYPKETHVPIPAPSWDFVRYTQIFSCSLEIAKIRYPLTYKGRQQMHEKMSEAVTAKNKLRAPLSSLTVLNTTMQRLSTDKGLLGLLYAKRWPRGKMIVQPFLFRQSLARTANFREESLELTSQHPTIFILLPVFQRSSTFQRFLDNYARAALGYTGGVELVVSLFRDNEDEHSVIKRKTQEFLRKHPSFNISILSVEPPFNRGKGLMAAVDEVPDSALLLLMDVDMEFSSHFLYRVNKNSVEGKSVFFPIYFVHYDPQSICYHHSDCESLLESKSTETGLWRSFSFGIVSVYKSDLSRAGGFRKDIVGWGLEDIDFYEKCLTIGLGVIRATDPGLTHRYHDRHCDSTLSEEQFKSCVDSGNAMRGSVKSLYRILSDLTNSNATYGS